MPAESEGANPATGGGVSGGGGQDGGGGADDNGGSGSSSSVSGNIPLPRATSVMFKDVPQDRPQSTASSAAASAAPTRPGTSASVGDTAPISRPSTTSSMRPGTVSRPTTSSLKPHSEADEEPKRAGAGRRDSAESYASSTSSLKPGPRREERTLDDRDPAASFKRIKSDSDEDEDAFRMGKSDSGSGSEGGEESDADAALLAQEIATAAANMPRRPTIKELVDDLGMAHRPIPLPPGARGDELMPAAPAPRNWEDVTRLQRQIRGKISAARDRWEARCLSDNVFVWREVSSEIKEARVLEEKLEGVFVHVFDYLVEYAFDMWAEWTERTVRQKKQTRKLALWMSHRELIRGFGAWIAVWAHNKDWRTAVLTGCLNATGKKPTQLEIELFVKSKRGRSLINEMFDCSVIDLHEFIIANGVNLSALLSMSGNDYIRTGVFTQGEKEKAGRFVDKLLILMKDDTRRLDQLLMWPGKSLNNVQIYIMDDDDEDDEQGNGGGVVVEKKKKRKKIRGESQLQKVVCTPKGAVSEQFMNAQQSELARDWAWGYVFQMEQMECLVTQVRVKMVIKSDCEGLCKIVVDKNSEEIGCSLAVEGRGGEALWYDFYFGHKDEDIGIVEEGVWIPGNFRVYIQVTAPMDVMDSNQWVYFLDHKPLRKLNHYFIVSAASFDNRHDPAVSTRCIPMEVVFRTKAGLLLDKDPAEIEQERMKKEKSALVAVIDDDEVNEQRKVLEGLWAERQALMWIDPEEEKKGRMFASAPPDRDYKRLAEIEVLELAGLESLRRQLLRHSSEPFEDGVEYMPNRSLNMQVSCSTDAAWNFRMSEFWLLERERQVHGTLFHCCAADGEERRQVNVPVIDVRSFTFDGYGDLFMGDSINHVMKYRPTHPEKSDFFARSWHRAISGEMYVSGVAVSDDHCYTQFMNGTIVKLRKSDGEPLSKISLSFSTANAAGLVYALGRFVMVDSHSIKVVSLEGEHIPVMMGGYESVEQKGGHYKIEIIPKKSLTDSLDNPIIMWDGCYLWTSEAQYRKIDDGNVPIPSFEWACFAPQSKAHLSIYGNRLLPPAPEEWVATARVKAELELQRKGLMMTPSVHEEESVDLSRAASHASRLPSQAASRTASKPTL